MSGADKRSYQSRRLRGERVWAELRHDGALAEDEQGRVEIFYRPGGKPYRAASRNLETDDRTELRPASDFGDGGAAPAESATATATATKAKTKTKTKAAPHPPEPAGDAIIIYTDGACTGNPGPMGIGVVVLDGKKRHEHSEYLGDGTNNIAELTAILRGIELAPAGRPLRVHTDSSYSIGVLSQGWKAKANRDLIAEIKEAMEARGHIRLIKVAGHAGVPENERCDELARQAVLRGR